MKKIIRRSLILVVIFFSLVCATEVSAKTNSYMNLKSVSLMPRDTVFLKVVNNKKAVKWSSSNKKIAIVKNGKVTAKKAGKVIIKAKVGKKTYTCKVTVTKRKTKTLVVYFSRTGNTKPLARYAKEYMNADIFEIEAAVPYSDADIAYYTDCRAD